MRARRWRRLDRLDHAPRWSRRAEPGRDCLRAALPGATDAGESRTLTSATPTGSGQAGVTGPGGPAEPAPSGPGELVDPVQGLAEAPCQFRAGAGRDVRDGHLHGHPRAGAPPGHREGAPVALVVGAVPGKAAR